MHEESLHISSALLQHASEQLHRHLDRGTAGHPSSEHPLPHIVVLLVIYCFMNCYVRECGVHAWLLLCFLVLFSESLVVQCRPFLSLSFARRFHVQLTQHEVVRITALVQGQMSVLLRRVGPATGSKTAVYRREALAGGSHLAEGLPATWRTTAQRMQSTGQMRWRALLIHPMHQAARRYTTRALPISTGLPWVLGRRLHADR